MTIADVGNGRQATCWSERDNTNRAGQQPMLCPTRADNNRATLSIREDDGPVCESHRPIAPRADQRLTNVELRRPPSRRGASSHGAAHRRTARRSTAGVATNSSPPDEQLRALPRRSALSRDGVRDRGERMLNTALVVKFFCTRAC